MDMLTRWLVRNVVAILMCLACATTSKRPPPQRRPQSALAVGAKKQAWQEGRPRGGLEEVLGKRAAESVGSSCREKATPGGYVNYFSGEQGMLAAQSCSLPAGVSFEGALVLGRESSAELADGRSRSVLKEEAEEEAEDGSVVRGRHLVPRWSARSPIWSALWRRRSTGTGSWRNGSPARFGNTTYLPGLKRKLPHNLDLSSPVKQKPIRIALPPAGGLVNSERQWVLRPTVVAPPKDGQCIQITVMDVFRGSNFFFSYGGDFQWSNYKQRFKHCPDGEPMYAYDRGEENRPAFFSFHFVCLSSIPCPSLRATVPVASG